MKSISLKAVVASGLTMILSACGGGGDLELASGSSKLAPTVWTSDGRATNSCQYHPVCSGNPYAPFTVYPAEPAGGFPAEGATLTGIVRLQTRGLALENVELLLASGYAPRLGVFQLSNDKTHAWLDFDTTRLPNGPVTVRASAFNVPAGQPGAVELATMMPRTWNISNPPPGIQTLTAANVAAPADGAALSGLVRLEVRGTGIVNAELLPGSGYSPRLGQFNVSADRTHAWLDLDTRSVPDGARDVRISVFNATQGQPGAQEVVAMPARRWNFVNGTTDAFHATVGVAPLHGSMLSGTVVLEVRGNGIRNVELLPPSGYSPVRGTFTVSYRRDVAYLNLDTTTFPNGPLDVRISAFDTEAGQPGAREIVAMPARQWVIRN